MTRVELTQKSVCSHMHVARFIAFSACISSLLCFAEDAVKHSQDSDLAFVCNAEIYMVVDNVVLCRHMSALVTDCQNSTCCLGLYVPDSRRRHILEKTYIRGMNE